ncbi:MAG TPA: PLP-dependent aminotransferase family protein, partial [Burkholderiaceae bacterium]|nr:PLP-dependent aminotransferase family protein [Burkholderiaceae bacterium]
MSVTPELRLAAADAAHEQPLYRQLYLRLRHAILSGSLRPGQRLASTRALASQMGMARNTVLHAFVQLEVEGYIQAAPGSGHFVSPLLPHASGAAAQRATQPAAPGQIGGPTARNAFEFVPVSLRRAAPPVPFRINHPAIDEFPIDTWSRLQARVLRAAREAGQLTALLGEVDAQGDRSLRQAIADHVSISRGVHCSADSVVVTAGAQHAIDILLRVLTMPGDRVGVEDPCFPGAFSAVRAAGCHVVAVPVDSQGADVTPALAPAADPRVLVVCPSKQFPLGVTMSLPRRLALIEWARRSGAWIIEDDYDSEYRFEGQSVPSLQGLDGGQHVIYVGTFSKVLFPSLRTGFVIAPPALIEPLAAARAVSGRHGSALEQRVLAQFIAEGHLARHIRRMRSLYAARQQLLLDVCRRRLGSRISVETAASGLQTIGWLNGDRDDQSLALEARDLGVEVAPLSRFCLQTRRSPALVLG